MATITAYSKKGKAQNGMDRGYLMSVVLDLSVIKPAANDIIEALQIPANTFVETAFAKTLTAVGATCTGEVGDGTSVSGYLTGFDLNSAAAFAAGTLRLTEAAPNTITGLSGGKLYTAADTIDLKVNNAATAGKVVIMAKCIDLNNLPTT